MQTITLFSIPQCNIKKFKSNFINIVLDDNYNNEVEKIINTFIIYDNKLLLINNEYYIIFMAYMNVINRYNLTFLHHYVQSLDLQIEFEYIAYSNKLYVPNIDIDETKLIKRLSLHTVQNKINTKFINWLNN